MINKGKKMSLNAECSSALQLLEHIQQSIQKTDDTKLQSQTADDLNMLISVFSNPILRSIVCVQDSLRELDQQLQEHPSILPVDLNVTASGELTLSVPPADDIYDPHFAPNQEFEDQRVPVAKLSHNSSTDTSVSPQLGSPHGTDNSSLAPITTVAYAIAFEKAIEESSRGRHVIYLQLLKPDGGSLGFSLVGLHSQQKGDVGIYVSDIQTGGIAARDGKLHEGDQILAIDGQPLDSNVSNQQAISILQQARGRVELVVARGQSEDPLTLTSPVARSPSAVSDISKAGSDMVLNTEWAQVELIDLVNDGSGLGFGIIGGRSTGVVVKTILPGGVADRDGRLQSGDHILQIGDVKLRGMGSEQVAAVLRQSGSHVRLVVARPVDSPDYKALGSDAPIVPTKILNDPEELDRRLIQSGGMAYVQPTADGYPGRFPGHEQDIDLMGDACLVVDAGALPPITMDMMDIQPDALPEMETFSVELQKDSHGLGITIAGYVCEKEELSGIFVKSVSEGSAADLCGRIQVNDRIVEVDGLSLQGYTNHQAVEVLRSTGQTVNLSLERYLRGPKFEQLQQAIAASELKVPTPNSPSAASLPRFPVSTDGESATEVDFEAESHTTIDSAGLELRTSSPLIDDDYQGILQPGVESAIKAKWLKVLGSEADIIVAQLCKLSEGGGLGISLEGTVDVEHGQEVRPHHYIRSILPEGPVGRNGRLRSGDELLEVNGHRLLGMNHIEVVSILKDLPMSVRMVCARRDADYNPHLADGSQDKTAAFAARNILGGSLQNLIAGGDRLVKAKSDGSLASSATASATSASFSKLKSRSLEPLTGLAMWSSEPHIIELVKGERGLGFSILDYQDPMNPNETVIVIRSLVPGGVAQIDGQLIPGDRLLSVNDISLEKASLDQAVQALKGAPRGVVRIGVAKPLPIPDSVSQEGEGEEAVPTADNSATFSHDHNSMFSSCESLSAPSPLEDDKKTDVEEEEEGEKKTKEDEDISQSDEGLIDSDNEHGHGLIDMDEAEECSDPELDHGHSTDWDCELGHSSDADLDIELDADIDITRSPTADTEPDRADTGELELEKSTDDDLSADLLQLMVPVSSERVAAHRTPSTGDVTDDDLEEEEGTIAWAKDILQLPTSLEVTIKIHKGTEPLGISVDSVDRGVNGMLVVLVVPGGAVARDGRLRPGDYLVSVNHESLRNATNSQTRAILRRTQLLSTDISVTYIPGEAASTYRKLLQTEVVQPPPAPARKTSPRSPYIPSEDSFDEGRVTAAPLEVPTSDASSLPKSASGLTTSSVATTHSDGTTVIAAGETIEAFPPSQIPSPLSEDGLEEPAPQAVCVVDGLYSVRSPKGNTVLVSVSEPIPSPRRIPPVTTIYKRYSFEAETVPVDSEECLCTCPSPPDGDSEERLVISVSEKEGETSLSEETKLSSPEHLTVPSVASSCDTEFANARSAESSAEEDAKTATTSPFYSPPAASPDMTIAHKMDKESSANILLAKHWGPERTVEIIRQPNTSLGISIVGGKVDLYNSGPGSESAILGIFIKNVLPNSPAGQLGELKTGDRILEVDSIDLRTASHERAVEVIRRSGTKVRFRVQSLIQWNVDEESPVEVTREAVPSSRKLSISREPVTPQNSTAPPSPMVIQPGAQKPQTTQNADDEDSEEDDEYREMEGK